MSSLRYRRVIWLVVLTLISLACGIISPGTQPPEMTPARSSPAAISPPGSESESCLSNLPIYPDTREEPQMQAELEELVHQMEMMSQASGEVAVYVTADAPSEVIQFYQKHSPQGGWDKTLSLTSPEEGGIIVWEKGDLSAQMFVAVKDQETVILLGCGPKLGSSAAPGGPRLPTYTKEDGLAGNNVTAMTGAADGSIWFGTSHGLSHFDGNHWTTYTEDDGLPAEKITCVAMEPGGGLWIGTFLDGAAHFDGTSWETYRSSYRDALIGNRVSSIAVAPDGTVWFGSADEYHGGVSHFDGENWETYNEDSGMGDSYVTAIAIAPNGAVWAGTRSGVAKFDGGTGTNSVPWTNYTTGDGLVADCVSALAVDQDGTVWVGTNAGVSRFDGNTWISYTQADGLINPGILAMEITPDGSIWVSTPGGISHFDGESWTAYTEEDGLPLVPANSMYGAPDGKVWLGTVNGVAIVTLPDADGAPSGEESGGNLGSTPSPTSETQASAPPLDISPDKLGLIHFEIDPPGTLPVGSDVTIIFTLRNMSDRIITFDDNGVFVGCRWNSTSDENSRDFGHQYRGEALEPGENLTLEATRELDVAGTWRFWPAYHLEGHYGPFRWYENVVEATYDLQPREWKTCLNPEADFTFKYPVEWVVEDEYFYETPAGEKAEYLTVILRETGNEALNDRIVINSRQPQCEFGTCVEVGPHLISTYTDDPEILDIFDKIVSTLEISE